MIGKRISTTRSRCCRGYPPAPIRCSLGPPVRAHTRVRQRLHRNDGHPHDPARPRRHDDLVHLSLERADRLRHRAAPTRPEPPGFSAFLLQHSLDENLGFYPAHAMLGDLALARGDSAVAAREFEQAAELAPDEAWIQFRYGAALLRMGRAADAIAPLQRAIALDPFYAAPYFDLGGAESARGNNAGTARALQQYLERAPRKDSDAAEDARRRLASLREPDTRP